MEPLRFHLNGRSVVVQDLSPTTTLLDFLRGPQGLTGTKEGCAEGDCGACTVVILDSEARQFRAINSCLVVLPRLQGTRVWTVEGIGSPGRPHPVQQAMVDAMASQCGYCTPGFVMSLFEGCYREIDGISEPAWEQISGNLCRCTGYRPLRDVAQSFVGSRPDDEFASLLQSGGSRDLSVDLTVQGQRFVAPSDFEGLFEVLEARPDARILAGGTDLGLEITKLHREFPCTVSLQALEELRRVRSDEKSLRIGAMLPLTDLEAFSRRELPVLARMLRFFGSRQIKHLATLGGNLCNASPIGDLAPVLLALDARIVARSRSGEREIGIGDFFTGYRETALRRGEILVAVEVDRPADTVRLGAYKVSRRRELDISTVAACFAVDVDSHGIVRSARLGYGGMAATPSRAPRTEAELIGEPWGHGSIERACSRLDLDFEPISDHRGSAWYRRTVAKNLLRGFFEETETGSFHDLPQTPISTLLADYER